MDRIERLRRDILDKVGEYHELTRLASEQPFVPRKSRLNYAGRVFDGQEMRNLVDASLDFWLTYGHYSAQFEEKLAKYLNVKYALLVNSGSSANLLAFSALTSPLLGERQIRRGDHVITVAAGFPTTVAPIVQYGAVPVFVDVDLETANVKVNQLEAALTERSRAVMLGHTLGNPFDVKAVRNFCQRHRLWLIEDNCDALGSEYAGQLTGTFGDIGTSSFYPPHHITMGEGGAVYTNNPLLRKIMLSIRDWGRDCWCASGRDNTCGCRFTGRFGTLPPGYDHKYVYSHFGYNLKATDMQAAIGCAQLDKLPEFVARRRDNFRFLQEALSDLTQFTIIKALPQSNPSWFGFMMTLKEDAGFTRRDFATALEARQIQTRNLFAGNITRHPCFETLEKGRDYIVAAPLENTDAIMNRSLWVGVYPGMTREKLEYIATIIRDLVGGQRI